MSALTFIRFGLPAVLAALGLALILSGEDAATGAGVVILGCAALVSLANALVRFSVGEIEDRTRDQDARDFYGEHGRWPDDDAPQPAPAAAEPAPSRLDAHPGIISRPVADREGRTRPPPSRRRPRRPRPGS